MSPASLSTQPLLQSLPEDVLQQLSRQPVIELPPGTKVFEKNSDCAGLPIILTGSVRVFKDLANGRRIELYRVTPSEPCILSLGCMLGGGRYPASGVTFGSTQMILMPVALFIECMASQAAFRNAMFRALADRLVNTMELVEEIATLRLDVRLAAALLAYESDSQIAVTHQQLADELGTVREMISRVLDDFAHQGLVILGRGKITLADPARLRALANTR
ncbi:MAG TPA: Crp/Fnr family transcriptional regulator [Noviherbaspirillum sp.]|uniref:Crp/Fnr family transcriptional regulator n=1 Tax=Noviherbaspirillum sp. TaxID=1926288 RepID=UPI002B468673|nr:Crp/Fnr family transcriptional regulator [Noviherbaspirillum sp.]HJV88360.1 Crp/Fnr family transcriptional regulator [Noviherbaspirillum sp.]